MAYDLHPFARSHLKFIKQFSIVSNFNCGVTNRINVNPYLSDYALYPDLEHSQLKLQFIKYLFSPQMRSINLNINNLLFTAGASEAIELIIKSFCEPNKDTVCITPPTFSLYEDLAGRHNCRIIKVNLLGKYFNRINIHEILSIKPKVIFLCSPNNPVGSILNYSEMEKLVTSANDALIVVDETYIDFVTTQNFLPLVEKYNNFAIIRSFSKGWGLAGLRAGVVIASNSIINTLKLIQLPFSLSSSAQKVLLNRIENPTQVKHSIQKIIKEKEKIQRILKNEIKDITKMYPSYTNFITACFRNHSNYLESLKQHNMLITDISSLIPHSIRLSIYNSKYNNRLVSIMREVQEDTKRIN